MTPVELLANHARQIGAAGHFDARSQEPMPSPCISVCRMSPDRSHCEGCFRTLDEIRIWGSADSTVRRAIWAQLLLRAGIPTADTETLP
ncbi:DUF1289 domain-containing protein [Acidovorax sp. A1169]|jgi:predicted Fe-S protein YdhL (DUF1289 family)|uniref:DUF1289 domain-containing protein n=1 Tax=Acidovorax sp. A1169 TaxID=3059524 RepID=UPI002737C83B|nr:DUF1289 domain-containing protein [Acidovorax sp. A1169]MDP4073471.1 DUF1289 domain-containing protein [Acidovorax sp. A1169]